MLKLFLPILLVIGCEKKEKTPFELLEMGDAVEAKAEVYCKQSKPVYEKYEICKDSERLVMHALLCRYVDLDKVSKCKLSERAQDFYKLHLLSRKTKGNIKKYKELFGDELVLTKDSLLRILIEVKLSGRMLKEDLTWLRQRPDLPSQSMVSRFEGGQAQYKLATKLIERHKQSLKDDEILEWLFASWILVTPLNKSTKRKGHISTDHQKP
jgi:hypothetical protein